MQPLRRHYCERHAVKNILDETLIKLNILATLAHTPYQFSHHSSSSCLNNHSFCSTPVLALPAHDALLAINPSTKSHLDLAFIVILSKSTILILTQRFRVLYPPYLASIQVCNAFVSDRVLAHLVNSRLEPSFISHVFFKALLMLIFYHSDLCF